METQTFTDQVAGFLDRYSGWFIMSIGIVTLLLVIPMILMSPEESASDNPGGQVYDVADRIDATLPPRIHSAGFIVEAREGDILTQAALLELYQNSNKLREADAAGQLNPPGLPEQPYLYNGFDTDRQRPIVGTYSIADAVQEALGTFDMDLERATDDMVKIALSGIMSDPRFLFLRENLSQGRQVERRMVMGQEIDYWTSPGLLTFFIADNEKLGGGGLSIGTTSDPVTERKEYLNRKVQTLFRGNEEHYQLWGIAIDAGLEIADEVSTAVPFIFATFIMVLVVVGVSLRSGRVVLLTAIGLVAMIIWLKGLSNLVGLKSSTTLDFIVPIAMISLGADFVIHAVNRYREEVLHAANARIAFRLGMSGVIVALTLAMLTDSVAFLSNTTASIETVTGFGIGAGLAIVAAFVILGLTVPLVLMRLDARKERRASAGLPPETASPAEGTSAPSGRMTRWVVGLARRRYVVLPLVVAFTVVATIYAFKLEASFEVKDFFKADSDFAVGLDKLDVHVGDSGGEPAITYIQGDLTNPAALLAIQAFMLQLSASPVVAKSEDGGATLNGRPIFAVLNQVMRSDYARAQIAATTGVTIGGDVVEFSYNGRVWLWPNSQEQLKAIYDYALVNGVPLSPTHNAYDHLEVGETIFIDPTGSGLDATTIIVGIPGTQDQEITIASRDVMLAEIALLEASPAITAAQLTGSPYTRQASLDATTKGLQQSLLVAVVLCLLVAVVAMRSVRYGVVTIIPIGLVVAWLYAFMYLFGFGLNFVTATIAAVSVGVGIDYAIHMTQRYREELGRSDDEYQALGRAAQSTGGALIASAATSILGFTIMAFAPMPMFSSYGILTAVMIFLAVTASLLVLPSLLLLVTPRQGGSKAR
jgi:predicted RND superfamily exporter protein